MPQIEPLWTVHEFYFRHERYGICRLGIWPSSFVWLAEEELCACMRELWANLEQLEAFPPNSLILRQIAAGGQPLYSLCQHCIEDGVVVSITNRPTQYRLIQVLGTSDLILKGIKISCCLDPFTVSLPRTSGFFVSVLEHIQVVDWVHIGIHHV